MPPKKAPRTEKAATANASSAQALSDWLAQNDTLLAAKATPVTLSKLLDTMVTSKKFTRNGAEHAFDWATFKSAVDSRTAESPRWFLQVRQEDLLCDPDGLEGAAVDCIVIAEASEPTLAPAHYVIKEHWPNSDLEDNAPERVLCIKDQKMQWVPVTKDDGSSINAFVLSTVASTSAATSSTASISFGFNTAPSAAPTTAAVAPVSGFGFGAGTGASNSASASAAPAPSFGFGFGNAAAPAAPPATGVAPQPIAFGFGNASTSTASEPAAPAVQHPQPPKQLRPSEVLFVLWSKARVKEMLKELKSGSRIVQENVKIGADGKTMKVVMQNDLKDHVDKTARELILNKLFAKTDPDVRKVDAWLDGCPVYDDHLAPHLQKFRAKFLKEKAAESDAFDQLVKDYETTLISKLTAMVDVRKKLVADETAIVEDIALMLKNRRIADKSTFRVLKFYPKNDVLPFRPFGKVSGISEQGEHVDHCSPPMYVFKNKLLQQ